MRYVSLVEALILRDSTVRITAEDGYRAMRCAIVGQGSHLRDYSALPFSRSSALCAGPWRIITSFLPFTLSLAANHMEGKSDAALDCWVQERVLNLPFSPNMPGEVPWRTSLFGSVYYRSWSVMNINYSVPFRRIRMC
jgi:hypothetical protein